MAATNLTLPLLGVRNIPVGTAPFQFPFSAPNLGQPYFLNGTAQVPSRAQATGSNGYFGLKYAYGNIPNSIASVTGNAFTTNSQMPIIQFAGGVVQSFGVFDYLRLKPNPFLYNGNVTNNFYNGGSFTWGQTPGKLWYQPNLIPLVSPTVAFLARMPFPDIMFSNYSGPPTFDIYKWDNYSHGGLYTNKSAGLLAYQSFPGVWNVQGVVAQNAPLASNFNPYVFLLPGGDGVATAPIALTAAGQGIFAGANVPDTNAGGCMAIFSPNHNNWLLASGTNGGQPALSVQPGFTGLTGQASSPVASSRIPVLMAVAADQALMAGGAFAQSIRGTVDPAGNFLVTPLTNAVAGGMTWLYIMGDLSGYYRINFLPQGPAAATITTTISNANVDIGVSGGFGIDINGNFWVIQSNHQQPALYSSLNLAQNLVFAKFPQVAGNYVGCRHVPCSYPWFG